MTVRVGVIGTGLIGTDHVRRLTEVVSRCEVVAVADLDRERARQRAEPIGAAVYGSGHDLIAAAKVDGVLVTTGASSHEEYVLASIAAGKPVFCEKPLATTQEACQRILDAETAAGRRLVQVGFMRRYDLAYRAVRTVIEDGEIGSPTLLHSIHRNAGVAKGYTSDMAITDTAVHDIDITRWLLGEEVVATRVLTPRRNRLAPQHLADPLVVLLETESGVLVDIEVNINIRYGYDVRCEVVGESGSVTLGDAPPVVRWAQGRQSTRVPADWRERFVRAYDLELQEWVDSVRTGEANGPSAWDGYAIAAVSDAAVQALQRGERMPVSLTDRPPLYAKG